jgi:hypothetical protein
MPKRVIDFDAMWGSDKLAACAPWAQTEYAWLYGLADASGCFEVTNLRVIWGRVAAIRANLTLERLEQVFAEFQDKGLLFVWEHAGKRYAHWTGSDVPGRLPPPSWRIRLEKFAPPVPKQKLADYMAKFARGRAAFGCAGFRGEAGRQTGQGSENFKFEISDLREKQSCAAQEECAVSRSRQGYTRHAQKQFASSGSRLPDQQLSDPQEAQRAAAGEEQLTASTQMPAAARCRAPGGLKASFEEAQAQDLDLNLESNWKPEGDWERDKRDATRAAQARPRNLATENQNSHNFSYENSNSKSNPAAECSGSRNPGASDCQPGTGNGRADAAFPAQDRLPARVDTQRETQFCAGREFAHRMESSSRSEKEAAIARELRVGQGPVFDPSMVRPEAMERARRREAARAAGKSP